MWGNAKRTSFRRLRPGGQVGHLFKKGPNTGRFQKGKGSFWVLFSFAGEGAYGGVLGRIMGPSGDCLARPNQHP